MRSDLTDQCRTCGVAQTALQALASWPRTVASDTTERAPDRRQRRQAMPPRTTRCPPGRRADGEAVGDRPISPKTHGDWELRCIRAAEGDADPCHAPASAATPSGNPVAEIKLFVPARRSAGGRRRDDHRDAAGNPADPPADPVGRWRSGPRNIRSPSAPDQGCFARIGLTEDDLDAFKRGAMPPRSIVPLAAPRPAGQCHGVAVAERLHRGRLQRYDARGAQAGAAPAPTKRPSEGPRRLGGAFWPFQRGQWKVRPCAAPAPRSARQRQRRSTAPRRPSPRAPRSAPRPARIPGRALHSRWSARSPRPSAP